MRVLLICIGVLGIEQTPTTLGDSALAVAEGNAREADAAAAETAEDTVEAGASQQLVIAHGAEGRAAGAYDTSQPYVPESKAAATKARVSARLTAEEAARAKVAEGEMKAVAKAAAEKAGGVVMEMIKADAQKEAKEAAEDSKKWKARKAERQAASAAAAMEPYHLAQLREQKISALDHQKAMGAMAAAKDLAGQGNKMAADANNLQAAGLVYQANQLMQEAHSALDGAHSLQENAKALYASASEAGGRAGYYVYAAQQAAAAAVAGTLYNKPPAGPSFLQVISK